MVDRDFVFYLGTHHPGWLERVALPLFVSRRRLEGYKRLPRAQCGWGLDSGGFSELSLHGETRRTMKTDRAGNGAKGPQTVGRAQIRGALIEVLSSGEGIVALEVRRPGEPALRARLCPETIELVALALVRDEVLRDDDGGDEQ